MINIIICGASKRGKSTLCKEFISLHKGEKIIYDVNNEYSNAGGIFEDKDKFLERVKNKKNCLIVFEESTIFFSKKGREEILIDLLVRKRHTNNKIILLFHSLRSIPVYILELCNYIILKKTADTPKVVKDNFRGFDEIIEAYEQLRNECSDNDKEKSFYEFIEIQLN
jgi:hypothetical protein